MELNLRNVLVDQVQVELLKAFFSGLFISKNSHKAHRYDKESTRIDNVLYTVS